MTEGLTLRIGVQLRSKQVYRYMSTPGEKDDAAEEKGKSPLTSYKLLKAMQKGSGKHKGSEKDAVELVTNRGKRQRAEDGVTSGDEVERSPVHDEEDQEAGKQAHGPPAHANEFSVRVTLIQGCAMALVIGSMLAVQTLCVVDQICYAGSRGDPARPTTAARMVIPAAVITAAGVAPLILHSVRAGVGRRASGLTCLVTAFTSLLFLVAFSRAFNASRIDRQVEVTERLWEDYSADIRSYYESPVGLLKHKRIYYLHMGLFGLSGFIVCAVVAGTLVFTLGEDLASWFCMTCNLRSKWR